MLSSLSVKTYLRDWVAPGLAHKYPPRLLIVLNYYETKMKVTGSDKHTSLLCYGMKLKGNKLAAVFKYG